MGRIRSPSGGSPVVVGVTGFVHPSNVGLGFLDSHHQGKAVLEPDQILSSQQCLGNQAGVSVIKRLVSVSWWLVLHPNNFVGRGFLPGTRRPASRCRHRSEKTDLSSEGEAPQWRRRPCPVYLHQASFFGP